MQLTIYRPTCKGMVYAKMFYGGMVLFSGVMASLASPPKLE